MAREEDDDEMRELRQNSIYQQLKKYQEQQNKMIQEQIEKYKKEHKFVNTSLEVNKKRKFSTENENISNNDTEDGPTIVPTSKIEKYKPDYLNLINENNNNSTRNENEIKNDEKEPSNKLKKLTKKYLESILQQYSIPLTFEAKLIGHNKSVTCLSLDKKGSRLITGSSDYNINMYDFAGMNEEFKPFRNIIPKHGCPVISLKYNINGSGFLCINSNSQPKIYDREGRLKGECIKGDMYIKDMNHTKGHTMICNGGRYWPKNDNIIMTWSQDSTLRTWDLGSFNKCNDVIKARSKQGKRLHITAADINNNCSCIILGCNDGTLQKIDLRSNSFWPKKIIYNAHNPNTEMSNIIFHPDQHHMFISRGGTNDDTMKIWDLRNFNKPVKIFNDLFNIKNKSNVIFDPDKKLIITTTSPVEDRKIGKSCLVFIDLKNLVELIRVPICNKPINEILYHPRIKQIICGCSDNYTRIFYDDKISLSNTGVLNSKQRKLKKKHIDQQIKYFNIINPNALRVFKKYNANSKKKKDLKLHKPELPHYGIGVGGRINTENFSAHVFKSQEKNLMSQVDPQKMLLGYNDHAENNKIFTSIYDINQPNKIFLKEGEYDSTIHDLQSEVYKQLPGHGKFSKKDDEIGDAPPKKKQKL